MTAAVVLRCACGTAEELDDAVIDDAVAVRRDLLEFEFGGNRNY